MGEPLTGRANAVVPRPAESPLARLHREQERRWRNFIDRNYPNARLLRWSPQHRVFRYGDRVAKVEWEAAANHRAPCFLRMWDMGPAIRLVPTLRSLSRNALAMMANRRILALSLGLVCWWIGGCPPPAAVRPFDPIPMRNAVGIITTNAAKIRHTLQAVGAVDGRGPTEDGKIRSYHVDGTLFFLAPRFLRFNLKKLGTQQLLVGPNDRGYWVVQRDRNEPFCRSYGAP